MRYRQYIFNDDTWLLLKDCKQIPNEQLEGKLIKASEPKFQEFEGVVVIVTDLKDVIEVRNIQNMEQFIQENFADLL